MCSTGMNRQLGTKWFTFYTKVRPCIASIISLSAIVDVILYAELYFSYWWMTLYLLVGLAQPILSIVVALKSNNENYADFVRFVKGVLFFEVIAIAYSQGVQQYIRSELIFSSAFGIFIVLLVIGYFLWYRLNVKYFEKRLLKDSLDIPPSHLDFVFEENTKTDDLPNPGNQQSGCDSKLYDDCDSIPPAITKHKETKNLSQKIASFWQSHKKLFIILTIVCFALTIVAVIGQIYYEDECWSAYYHYEETLEQQQSNIYRVGCGKTSCKYCEGRKTTTAAKRIYDVPLDRFFPYYRTVDSMAELMGAIGFISFLLTLVMTVITFIPMLIIQIRKLVITPRERKRSSVEVFITSRETKFCKYCGKEIDGDSIFCSFCGKRIAK